MRGKTNAINVGVSVIGEVIQCQVAESSRIEKGEFVETFYRGKTGYLPTPAHNWTNTKYAMKTNNYITKVPGDNNLFIYRAREKLKGAAVIIKLYNFSDNEIVELFSYDYGFVNYNYNTDLFFLNENYFFMFGYSSSEAKDYIALFKLSSDKKSFSLVQNFKPDFGDNEGYGKGRAFVINNGILYFNSYENTNIYKFSFDGTKLTESYTLIPITYTGSSPSYGGAIPISDCDIAKLTDTVFAYTEYSSKNSYIYWQVNVLEITDSSAKVRVLHEDNYPSSNTSYVKSSYNVARLTDEFFIVNGGGPVSNTAKDVVKVYHVTDGLVVTQGINISNSNFPLENFLEVKEGVVFAFYEKSVLKLVFDATTRTLLWGWNNQNSFWQSSTVKRELCLFSNGVLFIVALYQLNASEDNQGAYAFYTFEDNSLTFGFDGSDNLVNLVRSYSGGKISGVANQSGNEGDIIEINVPKEITQED